MIYNNPINDAIAATNVLNVGMAPAMAMGNLYMTMANSMGMAAMNQVYSQQQANITHQASLVTGIRNIYTSI